MMAHSSGKNLNNDDHQVELMNRVKKEHDNLISTLPKTKGFMNDYKYFYQGFWYHARTLFGVLIAQNQNYYNINIDHHQHNNNDPTQILLTSYPKSGTTWMKALLFSITTRPKNPVINNSSHPLLTSNPHECIPFIEMYALTYPSNPVPENTSLLATHIPFNSLPNSIKSTSSIVYIYRDPKDVITSLWYFGNRYRSNKSQPPLPIEEVVDSFCEGKTFCGPYWDHILSYWEARLKMPERIFIISYEEMMSKTVDCVKKVARFVGCPFSVEEEMDEIPERIIDLCSLKKLKDLEVNQPNVAFPFAFDEKMTNDVYFRKGGSGDYKNHLTNEMIERIDKITEQKLGGTGLMFHT